MDYCKELALAYRGEIFGREFFLTMRESATADWYGRRAFSILASLEHAAGILVESMLEKHGPTILPSDVSRSSGVELARVFELLPWNALMDALAERILPAIKHFEAIALCAPPSDLEAIRLLLEHERALAEFALYGRSRGVRPMMPALQCLRRLRAYLGPVRMASLEVA